jgi:NDP-sugar pyrophosphorylase family protein
MILAAGRATRLGALGRERAKALIEFDGRPLLEHHLRFLVRQGVTRVVVNASHLSEQIEDFASAFEGPPELRVSVEAEPLGTAGGVINALAMLDQSDLLVLYGDVVISEDLAGLGRVHAAERPAASLAVYQSDSVADKGVVELDGTKVTGFREKDPSLSSGWVNAGIYIVEPAWLKGCSGSSGLDFGHDVFPAALAEGRDLRAHRLREPVVDIGTPGGIADARARRG